MIKRIKLFPNNDDRAKKAYKIVKDKFKKNGFIIDNEKFELAIAIGGDGSFIRMIENNNFNSDIYYVGINAGTLGFAQEIKIDMIDEFIKELKHQKYQIEQIGIQETKVKHNNKIDKYYSLNEIVIRYKMSKMVRLDVLIDQDFLEKFLGDGIIVTSAFGSTAHNLSYGGAILFPDFKALQITPIGPINSKVYQSIQNPIIVPDKKEIRFVPNSEYRDFSVAVDGKYKEYENVEEIKTSIKDKKIKQLRFSHYNFPNKINEKILSN